ncbi:hypothetical protein P7K49_020379 [Saguinus oedipus]|uniref:Uncharacterized protein n=1 Tax=Saguinus oedipus TaxID=9490 RepID=A0ABQ9V2P5_SAGOE|nr:hypothetical protein P7K49_020379 [Saguinus oedipus]
MDDCHWGPDWGWRSPQSWEHRKEGKTKASLNAQGPNQYGPQGKLHCPVREQIEAIVRVKSDRRAKWRKTVGKQEGRTQRVEELRELGRDEVDDDYDEGDYGDGDAAFPRVTVDLYEAAVWIPEAHWLTSSYVSEPLRFCTDSGFQIKQPEVSPDDPFLTCPTLPFRDLDGKSHKPLPLGVENDRVFNDLWGKGNVPVVLNNPYSEKEQVSA